ncbi:hypothetical protein ASPCADRAFT_5143 [Aspergillus carbonarius ITEM 5010]|uniref:ABM domain-containing protein n=1 Tax=Aspergillus carbonarius (strain ITEM 5010) TaxID=602072 RepID=A0A1R3RMV2_ASPC5|nr:hypothetical protein ASPCADRAFT_5143 [Aspergillus carbonarius ITEM 5010]
MVATFININPSTPLETQLNDPPTAGPCILINTFIIPPGKMNDAFAAWKVDAELAKKQPGFISTQLHQAIQGSNMMLNYAVWESTAALKAYYELPEFRASLEAYPDGTECRIVLYRRKGIEGVCLGE